MVRAKGVRFNADATKMTAATAEPVRFAADRMLGRLTKWLRAIGQDVIYGRHLSGYGLIRAARAENRLILTRDRALKQKQPPNFIFIVSNDCREQLRQVIETCRLQPLGKLFSRCLECNTPLEAIAKADVGGKVPPYVFATQEKFSFCRNCQRVYWPATHQERMLEELKSLGYERR